MPPRIHLHLVALACLTLSSCVGIPSGPPIADRPLSAEEQQMVGTWTDYVDVPGGPGIGMGRAVMQRASDHTAVLTICSIGSDRIFQRRVIRWEVVNGKLHEAGGFGNDAYSDYTFVGPNYMEAKLPNRAPDQWCRYSPSPAVNVAEVLSKPMISVGEAKGSYARASAAGSFDRMISDFTTKGTLPAGAQRREAPRCEKCGNVIGDSIMNSRFCMSCRGLYGNGRRSF